MPAAKGTKAPVFNILAKMRDLTIHFKFNPTTEKSKGGQGKCYKQIWFDGDDEIVNPTFLNKVEQAIKYGVFEKKERIKNKTAEMKDKPSFAFGAKSSGDIGEFFMIYDDITVPNAIKILNDELKAKNIELSVYSRKITKRTYGSPTHPGDAAKKKQYLDAKDWTITIALKCNPETGRCFTPMFRKTAKKNKSGFTTSPIDEVDDLNIHNYLKSRTPVRLALSLNRMWIKDGTDRDGNPEYQTMPEIYVKQIECFPLAEKETFFTEDEESESDNDEEKPAEPKGMPKQQDGSDDE
jgi:hypothetical protein